MARPKILEYYDEQNQLVETNEDGAIVSDYGVTEVGMNPGKKFTYKFKNILPNMIELIPYSDDPDLHVHFKPLNLDAGGDGVVELIYTPPENRTTPLSGKWGADVIIG